MGQPKDSEFKDRDTMTLDLDDGGKLECIVLNVFPVNNREYIALLPMNDEGHVEEDAQIFLYRFEELGDDEVNLETIEDDDEFERCPSFFLRFSSLTLNSFCSAFRLLSIRYCSCAISHSASSFFKEIYPTFNCSTIIKQ